MLAKKRVSDISNRLLVVIGKQKRTRADICRSVGCDNSTLTRILNGQRTPSLLMLERILEDVGADRTYIYTGKKEG